MDGTLEGKKIVPTPTLNGSSPTRAGAEVVQKLGEMGYLNDEGMVNLPDHILQPEYAP